MKRFLALACAGALLAGCANTGQLAGFHAQSEKAETYAELLYQATARSLDGLVVLGKVTPADAYAKKLTAWTSLGIVRTAYNAGAAINLQPLKDAASAAGVDPAAIPGAQ